MKFKSIVVSVEDPKMPSELHEALKLADSGAHIHLLHAANDLELTAAAEALEAAAVPRPKEQTMSLHVRRGRREEETLRVAVEADADLIVLGAHRPAAERVVSRVMSWAACSVLVLAPASEQNESEGFVPLFPTCSSCSAERKRNPSRWFCDQHQQSDKHIYRAL